MRERENSASGIFFEKERGGMCVCCSASHSLTRVLPPLSPPFKKDVLELHASSSSFCLGEHLSKREIKRLFWSGSGLEQPEYGWGEKPGAFVCPRQRKWKLID